MSFVAALPSLEFATQICQAQTAPLDQLYPATDVFYLIATAASSADELLVLRPVETVQSAKALIRIEARLL